MLLWTTSQGEGQRGANLSHPRCIQLCHTPAQLLLRDRHGIVQIHRAWGLHPIFGIQHNIGGHAANRGGDRRHRYCCKIADGLSCVSTTAGRFLSGAAK